MSNQRLFFNSLKVIRFMKIHPNIFLKPIDCIVLSTKMCSNQISSSTNSPRILFPPVEVNGMTDFDKDAFTKVIEFPGLQVKVDYVRTVQKLFQRQLVKLIHFSPVVDFPDKFFKCVIFNPDLIPSYNSIEKSNRDELERLGMTDENFVYLSRTVTFDNWKQDDLIAAVLPEGLRFSGYSLVGHIAHFNLRTDLLKYKYVLGMIVLNKVKNVETVVNKLDIIDSTFRNFDMEVICGEKKFVTELKENGCVFKLDFSKVYWNSRLATEHERILKILLSDDVVYDVFAGVGPFAVPAAKKGCTVLANDLNPESVKWLKINAENNKVNLNFDVFNKDAKDFILVDIKKHLLKINDFSETNDLRVHIIMNLPSLALDFMKYFKGLFTTEEYKKIPQSITVYAYCFVRDCKKDQIAKTNRVKEVVISEVGGFIENCISDIFEVRHVATNKDMFRVTLCLDHNFLVKPVLKRTLDSSDSDDIVTEKHKQFIE